jgi:S-formylglutathione hydrolase
MEAAVPDRHAVLHQGRFRSASVAADVEYQVITPPGWDAGGRWPLVLVLHGADGSAAVLDHQVEIYDGLWSARAYPEALVACVSTKTLGGFYIDGWESLVADEFPRHLAEGFRADTGRVMLMGASMGGYGALKIAFADPARFVAVAGLSPAVLPGEQPEDVGPRNTLGVLKELRAAMADGTGDQDAYARNHVVARLRANAAAIRDSGLAIRIECGDHDVFNLHDGAEYLHRVLWELDVSHEYHLVRGLDHIGPGRAAREERGRAFLAEALASRGQDTPPQAPAAFVAWLSAGAAGPAPDLDFNTPEGLAALRLMLEPDLRAARDQDPAASRRYGPLPR